MEKWKQEMIDSFFPEKQKDLNVDNGLAIKYKNIPSKLYKYQGFNDYSINNLFKSVVWLSSPENFNDPYDCALTFSSFDLFKHIFPLKIDEILSEALIDESIISEDEKKLILDSNDSLITFSKIMISKEETIKVEDREELLATLMEVVNKVSSDTFSPFSSIVKESTVVSCFSELNDSIVMWSHYANHHKGFCLEYDFSELSETNKISRIIYPVIYQKEVLNVTEYMKTRSEKTSIFFGIRAAITKSIEWEYEKEWRIILPFGLSVKQMEIQVPLPKAIYVGSKIDSNDKILLKKYSDDNNIALYQSYMNENKFKIEFVKE